MSVPLPEQPLGGHCSVIFNETLYTHSTTAFQSLQLRKDAQWRKLPLGVGTSGAECVHAHRGTPQEALYIVGGLTSDPSNVPETGFKGVQRWLFNKKKWENIDLPVPVAFNLTNHGATFLETSQQLIIFSGTKWPDTSTSSADTYLIKTSAPYEVTSIPAAGPLLAPLVLPWGRSGALVVGGDQGNTNLKTFDIDGGWNNLGVNLAKGLPARGKAAVSLMDGDDGSKMLLVFDMTTAPATVTLTKVKEPTGGSKHRRQGSSTHTQTSSAPAPSAAPLTQGNWPAYNGSLAPESVRDGFSLAYEGDMVVISGGGDAKDPVAVFNARTNQWVNTTELFTGQPFNTESTTSSSESPVTTRPTQATSTSHLSPIVITTPAGKGPEASSISGGISKLSTIQLLFVILGSILGAILALAIAFVLLKRRRRLKDHCQAGHERRASDPTRMSFQDRGTSFIETDGPLPSPRRGILGRSNSNSWARIEKQALSSPSTQTLNQDAGPTVHAIGGIGVIRSGQSTPKSVSACRISSSNYDKERGSGWSQWFSGSSNPTNLVTLPQPTYSITRSSAYTDVTSYPPPQGGPLHTNPYLHSAGIGVAAGGVGLASVSKKNLQRSLSTGLVLDDPGIGVGLSRPQQPRGLDDDDGSASSRTGSFSSGISDSVHEERMVNSMWTPVEGEWGQQRQTVTSSVYPESLLTESTRNTGPELKAGVSVDSLSWLNLRQN